MENLFVILHWGRLFVANGATCNDVSQWTLKVRRDASKSTVGKLWNLKVPSDNSKREAVSWRARRTKRGEEIIGLLDNRGTAALAFSLNSRGGTLLEKMLFFSPFTFCLCLIPCVLCYFSIMEMPEESGVCVCCVQAFFFPPSTATVAAALLQR